PKEVGEVGVAAGPELVADVAALATAGAAHPARVLGERAAGSERVAGRVGIDAGPAVRLPVLAEAVVLLALVRGGQDGVGLVDRLEAGLGALVAGPLVGMVLPGELAEGLLDLGLGRRARNAERLVVVLEVHGSGKKPLKCDGPVIISPARRIAEALTGGRRPPGADRPAGTASGGRAPPAPDVPEASRPASRRWAAPRSSAPSACAGAPRRGPSP